MQEWRAARRPPVSKHRFVAAQIEAFGRRSLARLARHANTMADRLGEGLPPQAIAGVAIEANEVFVTLPQGSRTAAASRRDLLSVDERQPAESQHTARR
jgi:threonine aldolase